MHLLNKSFGLRKCTASDQRHSVALRVQHFPQFHFSPNKPICLRQTIVFLYDRQLLYSLLATLPFVEWHVRGTEKEKVRDWEQHFSREGSGFCTGAKAGVISKDRGAQDGRGQKHEESRER